VSSDRAKYLASILNRCGAVDRREEGEGERIKGSERAERSGVARYAESKEQEPERDDGKKERREIDLDRHREFSDSRGITFDIVLANASRTARRGIKAFAQRTLCPLIALIIERVIISRGSPTVPASNVR